MICTFLFRWMWPSRKSQLDSDSLYQPVFGYILYQQLSLLKNASLRAWKLDYCALILNFQKINTLALATFHSVLEFGNGRPYN